MNMHEKILDNLQELVYIADMETYELLYYNRALAEEFHIPQRLHGKCYEILQGRRDPCPFCTNGKLSQDGCYVWKFYNQLVGRHFLLSDSICEFNGRQVRTEIASDITEHVLLQEQLDKNLSLQNFINHCARKLYRQDADLPFLIDDVLAAGYDTLVTADLKYNHFEEAKYRGLNLIDAGHFETENPVCAVLERVVREALPELTVLRAKAHKDETQFL